MAFLDLAINGGGEVAEDVEGMGFYRRLGFRSADNSNIATNDAFLLSDTETRRKYEAAYQSTRGLYYK